MYRYCAVADELNGYIYMIGGYSHGRDMWQYDVRTNAWSGMADSESEYSIRVSLKYFFFEKFCYYLFPRTVLQ